MDKPVLRSGPTGPYGHGYKMCMVIYTDGTVRGITWHRYIYEEKHGRLPSDIHVHHRNGDKSDNRLINLEAKTIRDHARDHQPDTRVKCICGWCGKVFLRLDRRIRWNQRINGCGGPFYSRSCGASWGREKQLGRL